MAALLETRGLCKSYAAPVLVDVNFDLQAGEIHALVGENGAGKSTLCNIVAGLRTADKGEMWLEGHRYIPANKRAAEAAGIRIVLQELSLINNLTIAENLFLDHLPHRNGWINRARLREAAHETLARVGLTEVDPDLLVNNLGVGQKQLVEIAAGLSQTCKVLVLDEPTAALTVSDAERLFFQVRKLAESGVGIIYISHHLEEILELADRISVLRDGQMVVTRRRGEISIDEMIRFMVGRTLDERAALSQRRLSGEVLLKIQNLSAPPRIKEVSFELHRGEVLGFAGLMGAGRTETMRAIFGADTRTGGTISLEGEDISARLHSPKAAVRLGIGFLTEDRKSQGLLLPKALRMNITLARLNDELRGAAGWLHRDKEIAVAEGWVRQLDVRCSTIEQTAENLSGGNQQKVVLARWLYRNCRVLICDEPTRGIDVGAKFEIYRLLDQLAEQGKGIIVVSSDLKELLGLCDRIAVLSAGRLVKIFDRGEWTEDLIMAAAFSELKV
ncbi:MAG: sugar ABC transporter ATP-binding protein [Verrucomicrobia bacterium]|nr:sugar ABC transporter ATP-binding protein [Verrucomicrobiota bacterium]